MSAKKLHPFLLGLRPELSIQAVLHNLGHHLNAGAFELTPEPFTQRHKLVEWIDGLLKSVTVDDFELIAMPPTSLHFGAGNISGKFTSRPQCAFLGTVGDEGKGRPYWSRHIDMVNTRSVLVVSACIAGQTGRNAEFPHNKRVHGIVINMRSILNNLSGGEENQATKISLPAEVSNIVVDLGIQRVLGDGHAPCLERRARCCPTRMDVESLVKKIGEGYEGMLQGLHVSFQVREVNRIVGVEGFLVKINGAGQLRIIRRKLFG